MAKNCHSQIQVLADELQERLGFTPEVTVESFKNWSGTQRRSEILAVTPSTVVEVQALIRASREMGLRVRAAGSTHSWSPLFSDEGQVVVYMKNLQRPDGNKERTEVSPDPDRPGCKLATVASGVTNAEFMNLQISNGICIPSNVILTEVQMGGVIAPACHGMGKDTKSVSDYVVRMRIVNSNGDLKTYSMKDDPDMMKAVQCNLGLWGIMVDITFKTEPMIMVETTNIWMKVRDIFYNKENLQRLLQENWAVEIFYFPFNGMAGLETVEAILTGKVDFNEWDPQEDSVWIRLVNKLDVVGPALGEHYYDWSNFTSFLQGVGSQIADDVITNFPQWAPLFLKTQMPIIKQSYKHGEKLTQELPHAVHFRSNIEDMKVQDMAWCFNVDEDCSNVMETIQKVMNIVHERATKGIFPLNLPMEMRFLGDSDTYLAPNSSANPLYGGKGHACVIEILSMAGTPGWQEFATEVAGLWRNLNGARTHWCKEWSYLPDIDDSIRESYSQTLPKYLNALKRSDADPAGMFFNERLEKIFYPQGHPGSLIK